MIIITIIIILSKKIKLCVFFYETTIILWHKIYWTQHDQLIAKGWQVYGKVNFGISDNLYIFS